MTNTSIQITVNYFASMAETTGKDTETISIANGLTAQQVFSILKQQYDFASISGRIRVAINHHFSDWDTLLKDGDTLAFIQPVAGG